MVEANSLFSEAISQYYKRDAYEQELVNINKKRGENFF